MPKVLNPRHRFVVRNGQLKDVICDVNAKIRNIDNVNEIPSNVTLYCARHSLVMRILNSNIPIGQVALMLGRSINTISAYFHELRDRQFVETIEFLKKQERVSTASLPLLP